MPDKAVPQLLGENLVQPVGEIVKQPVSQFGLRALLNCEIVQGASTRRQRCPFRILTPLLRLGAHGEVPSLNDIMGILGAPEAEINALGKQGSWWEK